jgi:hypothetical protein
MKLPLTGSCQCGNIRYEITESPQLVYTCHCTDCQRSRATPSRWESPCRRRPSVSPQASRDRSDAWPIVGGSTPVRVPRLRMLDLQPAARWGHPRPGRNARRHIMAAADPAYLDAQ